jgi:hypothetical protein
MPPTSRAASSNARDRGEDVAILSLCFRLRVAFEAIEANVHVETRVFQGSGTEKSCEVSETVSKAFEH